MTISVWSKKSAACHHFVVHIRDKCRQLCHTCVMCVIIVSGCDDDSDSCDDDSDRWWWLR